MCMLLGFEWKDGMDRRFSWGWPDGKILKGWELEMGASGGTETRTPGTRWVEEVWSQRLSKHSGKQWKGLKNKSYLYNI